jgi:hypothetical protein
MYSINMEHSNLLKSPKKRTKVERIMEEMNQFGAVCIYTYTHTHTHTHACMDTCIFMYVYIWKCHNKTPSITIINKQKSLFFFFK